MKTSCGLVGLVLITFFLGVPAFAELTDHPVVKPMPRSQIVPAQSRIQDFASFTFRVQKGRKAEKVDKEGKYWHLLYHIKNESGRIDQSVSREEIVRNYKEAALEKGGEILYEVGYLLTVRLTREGGGKTWVSLSARNGNYYLDIIDEEAFEKQLTFGAEEMRKALDDSGRVAVYGIHFDVDKATLKLGSEKVLTEMVKLMKNNPELKIEIQGHTDATGSAEHNLKLSQRRASAVELFLLGYGIAAPRMLAKGYGEQSPVASNETEEGRALNRRVELVKMK